MPAAWAVTFFAAGKEGGATSLPAEQLWRQPHEKQL